MSDETKTKAEQLTELQREIDQDRQQCRGQALDEVCEKFGIGTYKDDHDESYRMARLLEVVDQTITEITAVRAAVGVGEETV